MPTAHNPLILYLKRNCLDDGPGIRTTVFFKGCPLSCVWCHNPEAQSTAPELSFDTRRCLGCGACAKACPHQAIRLSSPGHVDRERCDYCFACVDGCPPQALTAMGRPQSVGELMTIIEKDLPFFRQSRGGVTLSGGEPTMFPDFAAELARACRARGIHVLLETCGQFEYDYFQRRLLPELDAIYFDLKLYDSTEHRLHCGVGNERIFDNLARLARQGAGGVPVRPRIPLVPGITDRAENLTALARLLRNLGLGEVTLLPYNPTWHEKVRMLGREPRLAETRWLDADQLARCRAAFAGFELA